MKERMSKIINLFKEYVENPITISVLLFFEIVISVLILIFKHGKEFTAISHKDIGALQKAFEIINIPSYSTYLIFGLIWVLTLFFYIYWSLRNSKFIAASIYLIFFLIFWIIFGDPIVTTILTILVSTSLLLLAMDS